MENFFSGKKIWPDGVRYPHFLVTLDGTAFNDYADDARKYLTGYDTQLRIVPSPWLHCTIQGMFTEPDDGQMTRLREAARQELADMPAFQVQAGPIRVGQTAVTVHLWPKEWLHELQGRIRAAATEAGIELRPAGTEFHAHATLAYSLQSWDADPLGQVMKVEPVPRRTVDVMSAALVSQRQDIRTGTYTWDLIERFPFQRAEPDDELVLKVAASAYYESGASSFGLTIPGTGREILDVRVSEDDELSATWIDGQAVTSSVMLRRIRKALDDHHDPEARYRHIDRFGTTIGRP